MFRQRSICSHHPPRRWFWKVATFGFALAMVLLPVVGHAASKVYLVELQGPVGPVTTDFVVRGLREGADANAAAIILRIDTPGGLDLDMRKIIRAILASPVPVIGYVAPSGARAASAGTYIMYACHVAAMAPGTNLGAATPVNLFGSSPAPEAPSKKGAANPGGNGVPQNRPANAELAKVTNDAVAYIRGLAQLRHRNADWAESAIREAASLPYDAALKENVVDLVAGSVDELLTKANGRHVEVDGVVRVLNTTGATVIAVEPSWRSRLLATLTDPTVAYILLLIGIYGLIFEFTHPGIFAPGVIGSICLVLGLLALNFLPIDMAGVGLTLLGIALMVTEAFVPSFGALGVGGAVAFAIGSMMTFDVPGFRIAWSAVAGATAASLGLFVLVLAMLIRARRRPVTSGETELLRAIGEVLAWDGSMGEVLASGERWRARASGPLAPGQRVRIVRRDGLTLWVEPQ